MDKYYIILISVTIAISSIQVSGDDQYYNVKPRKIQLYLLPQPDIKQVEYKTEQANYDNEKEDISLSKPSYEYPLKTESDKPDCDCDKPTIEIEKPEIEYKQTEYKTETKKLEPEYKVEVKKFEPTKYKKIEYETGTEYKKYEDEYSKITPPEYKTAEIEVKKAVPKYKKIETQYTKYEPEYKKTEREVPEYKKIEYTETETNNKNTKQDYGKLEPEYEKTNFEIKKSLHENKKTEFELEKIEKSEFKPREGKLLVKVVKQEENSYLVKPQFKIYKNDDILPNNPILLKIWSRKYT